MGVTADFKLVSREQFNQVREGQTAVATSNPQVWFEVGKSWFFFFEVFETYGEPLSKVFVGDYLPEGFFGLYGGEGHLGYISPELVLAVGQALVALEPEHVFARAADLGSTLDEDRMVFYRDYFFEMKIGFRVAARCGGGLSVCIG